MKTGIVICSHLASRRIPNKPLVKINGVPLIEHLLTQLKKTNLTTIIALPNRDYSDYRFLHKKFDVSFSFGYTKDPLKRMWVSALDHKLDTIIRVTHDKIFVDPDLIFKALGVFNAKNLDYLYSSQFTDGTGFEIISKKALEAAAKKYEGVEHISYAIKSVTKNQHHFEVPPDFRSSDRLLIDYPEDLDLMELIHVGVGNDASLKQVQKYLSILDWAKELNPLPDITYYTCVYNGEKHLQQTIESIINQGYHFESSEYIIVDDHSTDDSTRIAYKYASNYPNIKVTRNSKNIGLAASSNVALKKAKGKYIIRMDADDFFKGCNDAGHLLKEIESTKKDVIYPNNYYGHTDTIQNGKESHHVGGAIFRTRALNHIKFTDKLRNYEGLDVYLRAKGLLDIGYLNRVCFFYRQSPDSMSKTNLEIREKIKTELLKQHDCLA